MTKIDPWDFSTRLLTRETGGRSMVPGVPAARRDVPATLLACSADARSVKIGDTEFVGLSGKPEPNRRRQKISRRILSGDQA